MPKNLHFGTNLIKLSFLEPNLWRLIYFVGHLTATLDLTHLETTVVNAIYLVEFLKHENIRIGGNLM